jgi:hypothetical protein
MLSKFVWLIIAILVRIGAILRFFPFKWNPVTRELSVEPKSSYFFGLFTAQSLGFKIMSGLVFGNFVFAVFRIWQSIFYLSGSFQDVMFQLFIFLIVCLANLVQMCTLKSPSDIAIFVTEFAQLEMRLTSKYVHYCIYI